MSHKEVSIDSNQEKRSAAKRLRPVIPASMVPLRAVLAKVSAESTARKISLERSSLTSPDLHGPKLTSSKRKRNDIENKHNKDVQSRDNLDKEQHRKDNRRKNWRNVKSCLERKAAKYDELLMKSRSQSSSIVDDESDKYLVRFNRKNDFSRDKVAKDGKRSDKTVDIKDEFGRIINVPENSSKYRTYLAEEAKKVRIEEIQRTSYLHDIETLKSNHNVMNTDELCRDRNQNGGSPHEIRLHLGVKDRNETSVATQNFTETDTEHSSQMFFECNNMQEFAIQDSHYKSSRKDKKKARIALLKEKKRKRNQA